MKSRRVFSTPDVASASAAIPVARATGILDEDISLIARSDIQLDAIPEHRKDASSDFVPAALRGMVGGGGAGLLAGLIAIAVPPIGITLAGAGAMGIAGALVGGWASALAGSAAPDPVRKAFEREIEEGRVLLVIDGTDDVLPRAEAALAAAGATLLPFDAPTVMT
jgi:hypothetical protein